LEAAHNFLDPELLAVSAMTLATASPVGEPHAAAVYFAARLPGQDEETLAALRLYFFSSPHSLHSQHLAANPHAAAAIYPACEGWQDIRGLQLRGVVRIVPPGVEWDEAWAIYSARFPFVSQLKAIVAQNSLYVFIPAWLRLVDNRRGFGFKREWSAA
jgi:uncharacterized protein YhbP (UPF0306 family)